MKLSNVKSWLTVEDAAKRLSASFGEDVSAADVIQLGLEGRLTDRAPKFTVMSGTVQINTAI